MAKIENIFISNLKAFLKENKIRQGDLAKQLGVSGASVSNYLSGQNEPPLSFLQNFKNFYSISLDNFLTKPLVQAEKQHLSTQNLERFIGNYYIYFYNTSAYAGRASSKQTNALKHGVLSVFAQTNKLVCKAAFFDSFEEASLLKQNLGSNKSIIKQQEAFKNLSSLVYDGTFEVSQNQIFIFLKSFNDQSLIILNNPPSNKMYVGGLGTSNSVSRGREHMPSIQFILLARQKLTIPEGEIYNLLALDSVNISVHNQTEKLLDLFKNLYLNTEQGVLKLEEFQKKKIFESALENIVSDALEANVFRFAKISAMDDDEYYNLIKQGE